MIINRILTGKFTCLPIFIIVLTSVFHLTFNIIGKALSNILAVLVDSLVTLLSYALLSLGVNPAFHGLIIDGICKGVGSVLSFVPAIAVLFFILSLLEESGYLPGVAAAMDKPMSKIGLTGKSIVPLVMGFGCAVPAITAASTLLPKREHIRVIRLIPFMSCSAKIPIYAVFISVFFENHRGLIMTLLYFTGVAAAILCALTFKRSDKRLGINKCKKCASFTYHSSCNNFVYSIYKTPSLKTALQAAFENAKEFVKKAFTVIFMASVIIWFLQSFNSSLNMVSDSSDSLLASLGKIFAPIFTPLGFGDWRAVSAIIAGFSAKEAIVSSLAVLASTTSNNSLFTLLSDVFSPLSAFSFMVFCLLYIPCIATITTACSCTKDRFISISMMLCQFFLAWCISFLIYNIGSIFLAVVFD